MWAMRLSIEFSLAAIMALILFFVAGKNNTVLNVILLAALFGFCLHPVLSLRWITAASPFAIKERRTLVAVAITLIVVVGFGIWVWPSQSESTKNSDAKRIATSRRAKTTSRHSGVVPCCARIN